MTTRGSTLAVDRFLRAYRNVINIMYADPKAIEAFAKNALIPDGFRGRAKMARRPSQFGP